MPGTIVRRTRGNLVNSVEKKQIDRFKNWLMWLQRNNVQGYCVEVGPSNDAGKTWNYAAEWMTLFEKWFQLADEYGIHVTVHDINERQVNGGYYMSVYRSPSGANQAAVSEPYTPNGAAPILEGHLGVSGLYRGLNTPGGQKDFTAFHNRNLGTFLSTSPTGFPSSDVYWYPGVIADGAGGTTSWDYLAGRGIELVRIGFRWERFMPGGPGTALDTVELGRFEQSVANAAALGMKVVADLHNYGEYLTSSDGTPTGTPVVNKLGSAGLTQAHFVDVWTKLTARWKTNPNIWAYGIMNEPHDLPLSGYAYEEKAWEAHSQAAVDAIRSEEASTGDQPKWIAVHGYQWGALSNWVKNHPVAWITDSQNMILYEAHQYFSSDLTVGGKYEAPFLPDPTYIGTPDSELSAAQGEGYWV